MLFPFLINRLALLCQCAHGFGVGFSPGLALVVLFFFFPFLTQHEEGGVDVQCWTRNPLAWLRSTPEDSQPFMSLMVLQSAFLYLRLGWVCLITPVFHFDGISLGI